VVIVRAVALATVVGLAVPSWLWAQSGRVVLVLDGSNSMWGRVDGTEKIVVARDVLAGMLDALPADMQVGLAAYGHRREKDCDDIEVLLPVGDHPRAVVEQAIRGVQPRGMTPITAALQRVADALDQAAGPTHVVLVSDGNETCAGDPCALVRSLRARGVQLTVHVVGFDVTRDEGEQLSCIADAGGGVYANASTTADLTRALGDIRQTVVASTLREAAAPRRPAAASRDVEPPYWRVEAGTQTYEGHYSVVQRLGEGLSIQLVNDDAVNVGMLLPVAGSAAEPVEHAFLSIGRAQPCRIVASEPPFQVTLAPDDGRWLRGTLTGVLGCPDSSAMPLKGEFQLPSPRGRR
jgi:hypothetical protein